MKKQYIQPESHVVVINLMGSVLESENVGIGGSRQGATELESREYENRFEDTDTEEDWDWE